jgi:hypothetical protein
MKLLMDEYKLTKSTENFDFYCCKNKKVANCKSTLKICKANPNEKISTGHSRSCIHKKNNNNKHSKDYLFDELKTSAETYPESDMKYQELKQVVETEMKLNQL